MIFISKLKYLILFCVVLLTSCGTYVDALKTEGTGYINKIYSSGREITWKGRDLIVGVHDGDTFTTNKGVNIRLFSVDTPEMSSHKSGKWVNTTGLELLWAKRARDYVRNLIFNKYVTVIFSKSKTYNRRVGAVFYKDSNDHIKNLAFDLINNGLARKAYISANNKFYKVPRDYYHYVSELEIGAQDKKVGFWKHTFYEQKIIFPKWNIVK